MVRSRMLSRVGGQVAPAASSTDVVRAAVSRLGRVPAEAGELAGDGDGDDRAALGALAVEAAPDAVQALLGLPGDHHDMRGLAGLRRSSALPMAGRLR